MVIELVSLRIRGNVIEADFVRAAETATRFLSSWALSGVAWPRATQETGWTTWSGTRWMTPSRLQNSSLRLPKPATSMPQSNRDQ
jgi:hypothetical protein